MKHAEENGTLLKQDYFSERILLDTDDYATNDVDFKLSQTHLPKRSFIKHHTKSSNSPKPSAQHFTPPGTQMTTVTGD